MTLIFSNHRFQYEVERLFRNFINEPGIKLSTGKAVPTNADRVLGATGKVTETIDNENSSGAVYVDGKTWTARSADGSVLPAGSRVEIRRMEGVKLIVEAAQKAPDKKEEVV